MISSDIRYSHMHATTCGYTSIFVHLALGLNLRPDAQRIARLVGQPEAGQKCVLNNALVVIAGWLLEARLRRGMVHVCKLH
jgi:hypothetical protein